MSHKLWLIIIETTIQVKSLLYPDLKVFSSQTDIPGAWIGLTISLDSDADIIYKWEDGFPMTSTYWAANQPDQQNIGIIPIISQISGFVILNFQLPIQVILACS